MVTVSTYQLNEYIGEEIERFLNENKKKSTNTYKTYRSSLNRIFDDWFGITDYKFITKEHIESMTLRRLFDYVNELLDMTNEDDEPKYKNATINARISAIRELIKFLYAWDAIEYDVNKLETLKLLPNKQQEIEMIPFDLAMKYINFFRGESQGLEKALITKLGIETALRAEELLNLDWGNFIEAEDSVIIKSHGNKKGKGNKEFLDKIDYKLYEELLQLKDIGNNYKLFNLKYIQLTYMMNKANDLINDTPINYSFHSFRKLAVTMCYLNSGNCIITAQKKARHSNLNTTQKYLRLTNLSVTGIISAQLNTDEDAYKTVDRHILNEVISNLPKDVKLLINNNIKNLNNK